MEMRSRNKGFTLLELIVAMAVFSMLLVLTLSVIGQAGTLSSGSMAKMEAAKVARECLDLIHRDLSPAMLPYNRTSTNSLQLLASPANLAAAYANPHSLFWQAPLARVPAKGNLSSVGYFVERSLGASPEENRFQLRRLYVNQSDAGNYDLLFSTPDWYQALAPGFATPPRTSPSGDPDADQNYKGWVADGVLGLWVRCLDSSRTPITTNAAGQLTGFSFNSRQAYQTGSQRYPASGFSALPPFIEIGLVTCSPSDIRRIKTFPPIAQTNQPANFYQDMNNFVTGIQSLNPGAKTISAYTRIIPILAAAP